MTKSIKICDRCGREVKWLYEMPRFSLEGLTIKFYTPRFELCEDCARDAIATYYAALKKEDKS